MASYQSPKKKIVILASGIADLATSIAVLIDAGIWDNSASYEFVVAIVGSESSIPSNLVTAFEVVARRAYGFSVINTLRWGGGGEPIEKFKSTNANAEIVLSNQLQDDRQRELIRALAPNHFKFYDNGLSSYADHKLNLREWVFSEPGCSFSGHLTFVEAFGVPAYLRPFNIKPLSTYAMKKSYQLIRDSCVRDSSRLNSSASVILGTSFDRTRLIATKEEKHIHRILLEEVMRTKTQGEVYFKPHPRATEVYLEGVNGVRVLPVEIPVEALVVENFGSVFSFSSTALFSLHTLFEWKSYRVRHPYMDKIFAARPQLSKIKQLEASFEIGLN